MHFIEKQNQMHGGAEELGIVQQIISIISWCASCSLSSFFCFLMFLGIQALLAKNKQ